MSLVPMLRIAAPALVLALVLGASPAWAQDPPPVVITGGLDLTNQYNFRGIRQNIDGVSIWPDAGRCRTQALRFSRPWMHS